MLHYSKLTGKNVALVLRGETILCTVNNAQNEIVTDKFLSLLQAIADAFESVQDIDLIEMSDEMPTIAVSPSDATADEVEIDI